MIEQTHTTESDQKEIARQLDSLSEVLGAQIELIASMKERAVTDQPDRMIEDLSESARRLISVMELLILQTNPDDPEPNHRGIMRDARRAVEKAKDRVGDNSGHVVIGLHHNKYGIFTYSFIVPDDGVGNPAFTKGDFIDYLGDSYEEDDDYTDVIYMNREPFLKDMRPIPASLLIP